MACDRVKRILQTILFGQKKARPTKIVTPHRWRVLAYAQDTDGEVEGLYKLIQTESPLTSATPMWIGKRLGSYVTYVPVSSGRSLLNIHFRNHGRTSRELPPRNFAHCFGDRILRGGPRA